jgi:serine/threonine protein kinase
MMADVDRPHEPQSATVPEDSRAVPPGAQSSLQPGDQVAEHFVVASTLGQGATGEVLAVRDLALDRDVAMKVLRGAGGPILARFMREARVTARLDHPNVPPVYSMDFLPDGGLIFTMRKLDGVSLGEALRRSGSGDEHHAIASVNACVGLALKVCDALAKAHYLGVIHRDVKPDNIMLGPHGEVALVDWGECRLLAEPDHGPAGSTVGTPAYMSPEQARGEPADERSDIYAFAACFWHVLTRRYPLWDEDPARFWERKRRGEIDALPPAAVARAPPPLLAIPYIAKTCSSAILCRAKDNDVLCQSQVRRRPVLVLACAAWLNRAQDRRLRFLLVQNRTVDTLRRYYRNMVIA